MHAVVIDVTVSDREAAEQSLRDQVVPRVSQAPGLVAAYWMEPIDGKGHSVVVFESEQAARAMAEQVTSNGSSPVTIDTVEVRAVIANT